MSLDIPLYRTFPINALHVMAVLNNPWRLSPRYAALTRVFALREYFPPVPTNQMISCRQ
jgi:hypothetical protein